MLALRTACGRRCIRMRATMTHNRAVSAAARAVRFESLEDRCLMAGEPWGAFPQLIDQDLAAASFPSINGSGCSIAILDTGVDYSHPNLGGGFGAGYKVVAGYDFVDNDGDPMDASGHGTGVASAAAGLPFVYNGAKYQGIASSANIIALRTENGSDDFFTDAGRIHQALQWVIAHRVQYNIVAINISTGSGLFSASTTYAPCAADFAALAADGVFISACAGNDGVTSPPSVEYPAADPNVYAVGSINVSDQISTFSSRSSIMDLLAPGENATIAYYNPSTRQHYYVDYASGTSFSSPAVAGLAALLKQIDPSLMPAEMLSIMQSSGATVHDSATGLSFKRIDVDGALMGTYLHSDDAYEDNDSRATATGLTFVNYSASLSGMKLLIGSDDFYKFTIDRSCDVDFTLDVAGTGTTPTFKLLGASGTLATLAFADTQRLSAGTYYLRISAGSASLVGSYGLSVGLTPDDAYEENDTTAAATPITFSGDSASLDQLRLLSNDADYYSLTLTATTGLNIEFSVSGSGSPTFQLLDAGSNVLANLSGPTAIQLDAGTYYLKAVDNSTLAGTYGFAITQTTDDSYENNDTLATATPIALSGGGGSLSNLRLLGGDADYYSFTLSSAAAVAVSLDYAGASAFPSAALLDASGKTLASIGADGVSKELEPGKYIIRVSSAQFIEGSYSIGVSSGAVSAPVYQGTSNDLAFDSSGVLHFAWYDNAAGSLKYATRSAGGIWSSTRVIDATTGAGQYVSLALDSAEQPGLAYYDATNGDLEYAHFDGAAWSVQTVDSYRTVGMYPSLAYDSRGTPVVTYYHKTYADLRFAYFDGSKWTVSTIDSQDDVGRYSSLALSPAGQWCAAYENTTSGYFKYAVKGRNAWTSTIVDDTLGGGGYVSLAFDNAGQPAFSYYDAYNADLKFAHYNGTRWQMQTVASKNSQGLYTNLFFSPTSLQAQVLYYNRSADAVYMATGDIGSWTFTPLAAGGGSNLSATLGPAGQQSFACMATAAGTLMVEDW